MNVILFDFIIFYIFCYFRILISLKPFINNIWYLISKLNQVKKMCHLQIYIYTNYTYTKAKKSKAQRLFFFSRENATIGKNCRKKRLYKTGDENQNEQINHHYKSKLKNCRRAWKCTHFQHIPHGISEFKRRRAISYGMYLRRVCVCVFLLSCGAAARCISMWLLHLSHGMHVVKGNVVYWKQLFPYYSVPKAGTAENEREAKRMKRGDKTNRQRAGEEKINSFKLYTVMQRHQQECTTRHTKWKVQIKIDVMQYT